MILAGLMFVGMAVSVRYLDSGLPVTQSAFIRYAFGLLIIAPLIMRVRFLQMDRSVYGLYLARGLIHGLGVLLWFFAVTRIPVSEVIAIGYSTPIFVALGAIVFFGERIRFRRAMAIVVGFLGMLVILRPGLIEISAGSLAQMVAAPCFAFSYLLTKHLTRRENPENIIVMLTVCCFLILMPNALIEWQTPSLKDLTWLFIVAVLATAGHYFMTRALASSPLTVTQPFIFLQLVWATVFGYLIFSEVPDAWVIMGGSMIVAAISYLVHRESVSPGSLPAGHAPRDGALWSGQPFPRLPKNRFRASRVSGDEKHSGS